MSGLELDSEARNVVGHVVAESVGDLEFVFKCWPDSRRRPRRNINSRSVSVKLNLGWLPSLLADVGAGTALAGVDFVLEGEVELLSCWRNQVVGHDGLD